MIAPTRELALQIGAVLEEAGSQCGIRWAVLLAGGWLASSQTYQLLACSTRPFCAAPRSRSSVCVYGGVPKRDQVQALRKGAAIVVATPGRLEDLMNDGVCR